MGEGARRADEGEALYVHKYPSSDRTACAHLLPQGEKEELVLLREAWVSFQSSYQDGNVNTAPSFTPDGQRAVTVFSRV